MTLTNRQDEIMQLWVEGMKKEVIAQKLGISPNTVRNHLDMVYDRMDAINGRNAAYKYGRMGNK